MRFESTNAGKQVPNEIRAGMNGSSRQVYDDITTSPTKALTTRIIHTTYVIYTTYLNYIILYMNPTNPLQYEAYVCLKKSIKSPPSNAHIKIMLIKGRNDHVYNTGLLAICAHIKAAL